MSSLKYFKGMPAREGATALPLKPITQRFKGPCVRVRLWSAVGEDGGRSSIEIETEISDKVQLFIMRMLVSKPALTDKYLREMVKELRRIRDAEDNFP